MTTIKKTSIGWIHLSFNSNMWNYTHTKSRTVYTVNCTWRVMKELLVNITTICFQLTWKDVKCMHWVECTWCFTFHSWWSMLSVFHAPCRSRVGVRKPLVIWIAPFMLDSAPKSSILIHNTIYFIQLRVNSMTWSVSRFQNSAPCISDEKFHVYLCLIYGY